MSEWKEGKISDIAEIITGFPFKGDKYEFTGELKVVRGENVTIGNLRWDSKKYWNHSVDGLDKYFLQENDVVIGMDGSRVGKNRSVIRREELPLILAQRVACLRAKKGFSQGYLNYLILSSYFPDYVDAIHTGTSIPHISQQQIADFEISYPVSYNKQQSIAEVLSSLDDKIDLLHQQNKTLEALAETLFRQWFVNEVEEGWPEVSVNLFAKINPDSITKNFKHSVINYLDTGSLTKGYVEGYQEFSLNVAPSRAQRLVQDKDIVYSVVRPNQRHYGIMLNPEPNTVVSTGFTVIRANKISPFFLYYLLTSDEVVEYFHMIAEGSTSAYPSLRPDDISQFKFVKPPESKIISFHRFAEGAWNKINLNFTQIQTLETLRNNLLPKLMSGAVTVGGQ